MKPKVPFDSGIAGNARRWCWPIRSIGALMIVFVLSGLTLWGAPMRRGGRASGPSNFRRVPAGVSRPRDRFVIRASPEIDPAMVIRAPEIDTGMVIHPDTPGRASTVAPRVGGPLLLPGQSPVPVPDRRGPRDRSAPPAVPKPGPR